MTPPGLQSKGGKAAEFWGTRTTGWRLCPVLQEAALQPGRHVDREWLPGKARGKWARVKGLGFGVGQETCQAAHMKMVQNSRTPFGCRLPGSAWTQDLCSERAWSLSPSHRGVTRRSPWLQCICLCPVSTPRWEWRWVRGSDVHCGVSSPPQGHDTGESLSTARSAWHSSAKNVLCEMVPPTTPLALPESLGILI